MSDKLLSMIRDMPPENVVKLVNFVATAAGKASVQYGATPTADEIVSAGAWAREATYATGADAVDWDNALWHLGQTETVQNHNAAKVAQGQAPALPKAYAESGVVTAEDIASLPPHLRPWIAVGATKDDIAAIENVQMRVAIGRALSLSHSVRNPTLSDQRDPAVAAWQDAKDVSELSPSERMNRARREGSK